METECVADTIAYCGLACGLCDFNRNCTGCKNPIDPGDRCDKDHCYHRQCCVSRGLGGCWECAAFPCDQGRFTDANRGQSVGFIQYIRTHGKEALVRKLLDNEAMGILYGMGGAYRHKPLEEINRLLGVDSR